MTPRGLFRKGVQHGGKVFLGMDVHERQRQQLVLRITEHGANRRIGAEEAFARRVGDQKAVHHAVVNGLKLGVFLSQRLLGLLPFADVFDDLQGKNHLAAGNVRRGGRGPRQNTRSPFPR